MHNFYPERIVYKGLPIGSLRTTLWSSGNVLFVCFLFAGINIMYSLYEISIILNP